MKLYCKTPSMSDEQSLELRHRWCGQEWLVQFPCHLKDSDGFCIQCSLFRSPFKMFILVRAPRSHNFAGRLMIVKTTISDLVQIPPHEFYKPSRQEVEDKINEKYSNKVRSTSSSPRRAENGVERWADCLFNRSYKRSAYVYACTIFLNIVKDWLVMEMGLSMSMVRISLTQVHVHCFVPRLTIHV